MEEKYFRWLLNYLGDCSNYTKLLKHLYLIDYVCTIPLDKNRAEDGINLRSTFCNNYIFKNSNCSMLELLIGIAIRIENDFMATEYCDRTSKWFWSMIESLGLNLYTNDNYSEEKVDQIIFRFLNHQYLPNGRGSLFYVPRNGVDFRNLQLWDQMNYWLNFIFRKEISYDIYQ